jgi:hypothetical protein
VLVAVGKISGGCDGDEALLDRMRMMRDWWTSMVVMLLRRLYAVEVPVFVMSSVFSSFIASPTPPWLHYFDCIPPTPSYCTILTASLLHPLAALF